MAGNENLPRVRVRGPGDLLLAVPYLIGFHPERSVVLIGMRAGLVYVTARIDLTDATYPMVCDIFTSFEASGVSEVFVAVFAEQAPPEFTDFDPMLDAIEAAAAEAGLRVVDEVVQADGRWWSLTCAAAECCPPEGRPLAASDTSVVAAQAAYAGLVALPDREALVASLAPESAVQQQALRAALWHEWKRVTALDAAAGATWRRSVKRRLFAAARTATRPGTAPLTDQDLIDYGAALRDIEIRDAVWLALDGARLPDSPLWAQLARRLPEPFSAAPLFLLGWAAWRRGDGARASVATERVLSSDPDYSAADLLLAALGRGVDPRLIPKLRSRGCA